MQTPVSPPAPRTILTSALAAQTGFASVQQGFAVLSPFIAQDLGLGLVAAGGLVTAMTIGMSVMNVPAGYLLDRYGPYVVSSTGLGLLTLIILMLALLQPHTLPVALLLLLLFGLASPSVPISGASAVFLAFTGKRRATAMGIRQTGVPLGAAIAAAAFPTLATLYGLHSVYWLLLLLVSVPGLLFVRAVKRLERPVRPAGDTVKGLARYRKAFLPALLGFLLAAGQYTLITFTIPTMRHLGLTLVEASAGLTLIQVGGFAGRIVFAMISERPGMSRPRMLSLVMLLGAGAFITLSQVHSAPLWLWLVLLLALGLGGVGWNALVLTWAGERVHAHDAGTAIGLSAAFIFFGAALFPLVFGAAATSFGLSLPWLLVAAMYVIAFVLLWGFGKQAATPTAATFQSA